MGLRLGGGVYSVADAAKLLHLPYSKVGYWVRNYWSKALPETVGQKYTWTSETTGLSIDFNTLIEIYVLAKLQEQGLSTKKTIKAYKQIVELTLLTRPFLHKTVIEKLLHDGANLTFEWSGALVSLDGTKQTNLGFLRDFLEKLEFDDDIVARYYPAGKDSDVLVDPKRQMGQPILKGTNIYPETIYELVQANEPKSFIAYMYSIDEKAIDDAVTYCEAA